MSGETNLGDSSLPLAIIITAIVLTGLLYLSPAGKLRKLGKQSSIVSSRLTDLEDDLMGLPPIEDIVRFSSLLHPHMNITEKGYPVLDPS